MWTSDEDLSAMYLSAKQINEPRSIQDHEELELLLESFAKQVEEILGEVETIAVSAFWRLRAHSLIVIAFGKMLVKYSVYTRDCRTHA